MQLPPSIVLNATDLATLQRLIKQMYDDIYTQLEAQQKILDDHETRIVNLE